MRTTTCEKLSQLQKNPSNVRNICILAHVDHGKTTLADALVASNGIISQRMAGKLRYMDSREDEQTRGITMKSSAISLHFATEGQEYLVNLIDSPGHVDFSGEVSTAVRLCDGAVVVVDVVEGVCPQTHAVLRQAWLENIRPILVLNKLDRLITELKMDTLEAFLHLQQILEQVNVVTSELFTADIMSMQTTASPDAESSQQNYDWTEDADEMEHKNIYFSPELGNVVFASAYDGWGFNIDQFATIYSKKLGMNEAGLRKTLWGDFYLNTKTKRIMKGAQAKCKKPLFVQFVLDSLWSVYDAILRRDKEMTAKIVTSLGLKISVRDTRHNDPRIQLQAILGQWLPVSTAVLDKVVAVLPSPLEISEEKVEKLMCNQAQRFDSLPTNTQALKDDFLKCNDSPEAPVIVFVSKMFPVDHASLPCNKQRPLTEAELERRREAARQRHADRMEQRENNPTKEDEGATDVTEPKEKTVDTDAADKDSRDEQVFVAFARVYSGCVRKGQKLYVLGPKHDPAKALLKGSADPCDKLEDLMGDNHVTVVTVTDLYMFMGRELECLESVPAGNVLGIGGLEEHILNSGTVSSTMACPAFTDLYFEAPPILRVALEPVNAGDMVKLVKGLRLLNQADACVQVLVQETGEHVIVTAGEVHLRRCLDDLQQRYAKVEISASSPIVPFRETIVPPPTVDMVKESIQDQPLVSRTEKSKEFKDDEDVLERGLIRMCTPSKNCTVQIRAEPLPAAVTDYLDENQALIKTLDQYVLAKMADRHIQDIQVGSKLKASTKEAMKEFQEKLEELFREAGKQWKGVVDKIWAFGPKRMGPNLLVNKVTGYDRTPIWDCLVKEKKECKMLLREFDYSVVSGFQLATLMGPLCDEPMRGVCFIVEDWEVDKSKGFERERLDSESCNSVTLELDKVTLNSGQVGHNNSAEVSDISKNDGNFSSSSESNICDDSINKNLTENDKNSTPVQNGTSSSINGDHENSNSSEVKVTDIQGQGSVISGDESSKVKVTAEGHGSEVKGEQQSSVQGYVSGQLMSLVKEACQKAFQTQPERLMTAMYKCNIQATTDVLGKLFAVIGKRHGRILSDEMKEGSQIFNILASLPVVESFGFCEDIRKRTSGLASPQLVFSHWEVIDIDPFWVPTTEEEIMHYGEKADSENRARVYMNSVRERKGLKVDKKIVEHAEKQRTLTRNK